MNLFVVGARPWMLKPRMRESYKTLMREGLRPNADLQSLRFYINTTRNGWRFMLFYSMLLMGAATFLGETLDGYAGSRVGLAIGLFSAGVSLVGELDQVWRLGVLRSAQRRLRTAGEMADERTLRLLRIARINDGTPLLQIAVGLAVALPIALLR